MDDWRDVPKRDFDREQTASVENRLKALIQQYYGHVEAKNYTVEDNL